MCMSFNRWFVGLIGVMLGVVLAQAVQSCSYTQKITDGTTAYELKRYHEAVPLLTKEYNRTKSRVDQGKLAYMLGESYAAQHQPADALDWYRRAYDYQFGPQALEAYAEMLMQTEQYTAALAAYKELGIEIGSRYQYRRQMQAAQLALEFDESRARYAVEAQNYGNGASAYGPSFAGDDALFISTDKRVSEADAKTAYAWTGRSYSDLYLQPTNGAAAEPLDERINGEFNEGAAALSPDGEQLAFTRCAPLGTETGYCQLYIAEREGDIWSEPQPLTFQEDEINYMHPAWSADGSVLYYSSNHPDGVGGYDLYMVEKMPPHDWSAPVRLPRTINTIGNEQWPSVKGDSLFFSSDGHAGFGGLDIYRVYPVGSDVWSTPTNLMPPLNSGGDDFSITWSPAALRGGKPTGYFSSSRGAGLDQIFKFELLPPPPPPAVDTTARRDSLEAKRMPRWLLTINVVEPIRTDPSNPSSQKLGLKPLESAALTASTDSVTSELTVVEPGVWQLELKAGRDYRFLANAPNYLAKDGSFSTRDMRAIAGAPNQDFEIEIELSRIFAGREIVLDDIYYDFDKADIRSDAEPTLRELARDLQLNPEVRIRLGSHTDCRGQESYNRALSQRRAESAVQFLIAQGIEASRLEAVGYGEDVARTDCACSRCTEEEHQLNRRTTFAILE